MASDIYFSFGADVGGLEAANAKARAEVRGLTAEMNSLGREMQKTGADMDSALGAKLNALGHNLAEAKAQLAEYSSALREHNASTGLAAEAAEGLLAKFRQFSEGITGVHEAFSSAAETFAAAFAVDKIAEWVSAAQDAAEKTERLAAQLGASTDQVQVLGAVAKLTGTDFNTMAESLERTQLRLRESASSSNPTQAALKALGIEAKNFVDLPIPQQLETLAEAFSSFADGPTKTAAAMALLGRAGAEMIPVLDRGADGFAELERTARAAGVVLSDDDVKALADAKEQSSALSLSITGLSEALLADLDPAISGATRLMTGFAGAAALALRSVREWGAVITASGAAEGGLGAPGGDNAILLEEAASIPTDLSRQITVNAKPQVPDFTTGRSAKGGGAKGKNTDAEEAEEAYQTQVDAARNAATGTINSLDNMVRQHKISWDEWAKDSVAALEQEKAAIVAAANTALQSASLTSIEKQRIMNEEARALTEISKKEADDQAKAAEEATKAWDSFFKPFNAAIESQIGQVISGHEKMGQALKKTLDTMLADVLKFFLQWGLKAAENVVAQVAGNNLIAASQQAGSVAGLGSLIANAMRAITIDAGQTAAGVTAFMAPLTGPAAVGVGEAAGATVLGMAAFDVGAWKLPSDQVGLIHQNELIMPAGEAGAFRSMLSGMAANGSGADVGGNRVSVNPQTNFHIHSMDSATVERTLRDNNAGVAKALEQAVRHGSVLGLRGLRR